MTAEMGLRRKNVKKQSLGCSGVDVSLAGSCKRDPIRRASLSTQASESTRDSSESDSFSDSSIDAWSTMAPPPPQRMAAESGLPPAKGYDTVCPAAMVSGANSPSDFAAAWNVVANVAGWKREEPKHGGYGPDHRGAKTMHPKQVSRKSNHATRAQPMNVSNPEPICGERLAAGKGSTGSPKRAGNDDCAKGIPLPKWVATASKTDIGAPTAATVPKLVVPPGLPPPGVFKPLGNFKVHEQLEQAEFVYAVGYEEPLQQKPEHQSPPLPGLCNRPLKIGITQFDCPKPSLNPTIPCKKRVPDWDF